MENELYFFALFWSIDMVILLFIFTIGRLFEENSRMKCIIYGVIKICFMLQIILYAYSMGFQKFDWLNWYRNFVEK